MIALRVQGDPVAANNGLFFLHSDHLGSTSLTTDASGSVVARQLYDAWGNVRLRGDVKTDIGYTSQREEVGIHAMFYRARYFSPALGRFLSADSIIPGAADGSGGGAGTLGVDSGSRLTTLTTDFHEFIGQVTQENQAVLQYGPFFQWSEQVRKDNPVPSGPLNPQALNRYSYVLNNPLRYTDPKGHFPFLLPLLTGAIGAIASGIGSAVGQLITTGHVDGGDVGIAMATGFVAGAAAPFGVVAAVVAGGASNLAGYEMTTRNHFQEPTTEGRIASTVIGAVANGYAGTISKAVNYTGSDKLLFDAGMGLLNKGYSTSLNWATITGPIVASSNLIRSTTTSVVSNLLSSIFPTKKPNSGQ